MAATVSTRRQKEAKRRGGGTPDDEASSLRFGQGTGKGQSDAVPVRRCAEDVGVLGDPRTGVGDVDGDAAAEVRGGHGDRRPAVDDGVVQQDVHDLAYGG